MTGRSDDGGSSLQGRRSPPRRLPRGRHGLPRDFVVRNQRERLIAAVVEAVDEHGYAGTNVRQLLELAGVSRATFYEQFDGLDDCMLSAFRELCDRLVAEVGEACAEEDRGDAAIRAGVHRTLELLAGDPPSARFLTIEILAAGSEGARAQHAAYRRLADLLGDAREKACKGPDSLPRRDWATIVLLTTMIAERTLNGQADSLSGVGQELAALGLFA